MRDLYPRTISYNYILRRHFTLFSFTRKQLLSTVVSIDASRKNCTANIDYTHTESMGAKPYIYKSLSIHNGNIANLPNVLIPRVLRKFKLDLKIHFASGRSLGRRVTFHCVAVKL